QGLEAIVATSPENVAYCSGAAPPSQKTVRSRLAAAVIPRSGAGELVAVGLEGPIVRLQSRLESIRLYREFLEDPVEVVAESLVSQGLAGGTIGVEETHLSVSEHRRLERALPKARFVPVDDLLGSLRTIKTPSEIELLADIGRAADTIALEVR